jgi:GNAT superfamily N-acetyltransferase
VRAAAAATAAAAAAMTLRVKTRRCRAEDLAFVEEMIVAACFPPVRALPTVDEARQFPHAARWLGPPISASDIAVVAEAEGIGPIAAAVGRRFEKAEPSWGVISPDVPELALAVASEHRGKRVGEALLRGWLDELRASGFTSASLTVSLHNEHALRLYARCGFREVMRDERRVLMSLPSKRE